MHLFDICVEHKVKMVLSNEDKVLLKALVDAGYTVAKILTDFEPRGFKKSTIYDFVKKLREVGNIDRRVGSGRPRSVRTQVSF